jgi:hypothetical protein
MIPAVKPGPYATCPEDEEEVTDNLSPILMATLSEDSLTGNRTLL